MASTYSDYKFELIGTGEQAGTWGNTTNTNIGTAIEQAIGGKADITMSSTSETLTLTDTNALQDARALYLNLTGTPGGDATLEVPAIEKPYLVKNATTGGYAVTVKVAGQTGVSVSNGQTKFLYNNGTDVVAAVTSVIGPASSTDNGVALFDGTSGELLKDSAAQDGFIYSVRIGRGAGGVSSNTVLGNGALAANQAGGINNTAVGRLALALNTTGDENTAVGSLTLDNNTTGVSNTAIGHRSLETCTTGTANVGVGVLSLRSLTIGTDNVAIGYQAGDALTEGSANVFVGRIAGSDVTTGGNNTFVGEIAAYNATGSNNVALGKSAGTSSSPFNISTNSNRVVIGDSNITNAYIQVAWTVVSDARDKTDVSRINHGLNLISKLSPVTFRWDSRNLYYYYDENGELQKPEPDGSKKNPLLYSGFLAQEVQQAIEEVGYPENIIVDTEDPENLKLKETALIPVLVNAVKELKAELDTLKAEIATLKGG